MTAAAGTGAASGVGALVVLGLILACVVLFRSMTKQLKRVPPSFGPTTREPGPPAGPAASERPPDGAGRP